MGRFVHRSGSDNAGKRTAVKAVSDAPRRFEEELGRELSAGTSHKGALVPWGGDVARATDVPRGAVGGWGVLERLPRLSMCSSESKNWACLAGDAACGDDDEVLW